MKLSRLCTARIGRAVIAAFAAQVVAAAMCLMPANAMAGGMAMHDDACIMHHATQSHAKHACPHCDAPAQAVSQIDIGHGLQAPAPVLVAVLSMPQPTLPVRQSSVPVERILAPPGSASLIYSTNLRIRI